MKNEKFETDSYLEHGITIVGIGSCYILAGLLVPFWGPFWVAGVVAEKLGFARRTHHD